MFEDDDDPFLHAGNNPSSEKEIFETYRNSFQDPQAEEVYEGIIRVGNMLKTNPVNLNKYDNFDKLESELANLSEMFSITIRMVGLLKLDIQAVYNYHDELMKSSDSDDLHEAQEAFEVAEIMDARLNDVSILSKALSVQINRLGWFHQMAAWTETEAHKLFGDEN